MEKIIIVSFVLLACGRYFHHAVYLHLVMKVLIRIGFTENQLVFLALFPISCKWR